MNNDDTPINETPNVVDFKPRFGTIDGNKDKTPTWEIMFHNGTETTTETAQGYVFSLMPFLIITDKENGATPNNAVFSLPADRIVRYKRI